jgi:hypothetical protein
MKLSSLLKVQSKVRGSILGSFSNASSFCILLYWLHLDSFNIIYQDFIQPIILQCNVRISLVLPIKGNNIAQEQPYMADCRAISKFKKH